MLCVLKATAEVSEQNRVGKGSGCTLEGKRWLVGPHPHLPEIEYVVRTPHWQCLVAELMRGLADAGYASGWL